MALVNEVYSYIEKNYKPNEPIFLAELNIPDMKAVSVRQKIKKLTEDGRLKRFDTGIYYIVLARHYLSMRLSERSTCRMVPIAVVMLEESFLLINWA